MIGAGRALAVLALAGAAQLCAAQGASAGSASGRPALFVAAAGERNDLTVGSVAGTTVGSGGLVAIERVTFADAGIPISVGSWCLPLALGEAQCEPDGAQNGGIYGYQGPEIRLGDADDKAHLGTLPRSGRPTSAIVDGGPGDDLIENTGASPSTFDGGDGNDTLIGGLFMSGGAGADLMRGTPDQFDLASYADHDATGVRVTLDGKANDGLSGEGDDAQTRNVGGSPGPDVITGSATGNRLEGATGDDVLDGGGGDDELSGDEGADRLIGGTGDDNVDASFQSVGISGVPDRADTVSCGAGDDRVTADPVDRVAVDCELATVRFNAPPAKLTTAARMSAAGVATYTLRLSAPATAIRGSLRLLDSAGRALSSRARFTLSEGNAVARVPVRIGAVTRQRLARSRAGKLTVIAERTSRPADQASGGYERVNTRVTLRRAARR